MKILLLSSKLFILTIALSITAMAQYTGSYPNVAALKAVTASDSVPGFEPSKAVDESLVGHCAIPGDAPAWIQIDLGTFHEIDGFGMILPNAGEIPRTISFQVGPYGTWWSTIKHVTTADPGTYMFDLTDWDSVRYVRIYMTAKDPLASFTEIYVYGQEMALPNPPTALAATNMMSDGFTANWSQGSGASGFQLSVTTDPGFTAFVPGYKNLDVGDVQSYEVTGLEPITSYYYRVRAYNVIGNGTYSNMISLTTPQATQAITFDSLAAYAYGDSPIDLDAVASSGLPVSYTNSDETVASLVGSTITILKPGTTVITASQEGDEQYLPATPVAWNLVVNRRALTVPDIRVADKVYDGTDEAVISGAVLTGVVGDDEVSLVNETAGTFSQADVGTGIMVSTSMTLTGSDTANYDLSVPSLMADITAKGLIVTAEDKEREECASNPEFTVIYDGFVDGEDATVLDSEPVASCMADEGSVPGVYDITVDGGSADNYSFLYETGVLTITPDLTEPEFTVQDITIQLQETGFAIVAPADVVTDASDNCSLADTTLSQSIFTVDDIGTVSIDVVVTDAAGNSSQKSAVVTVEGSTGFEDHTDLGIRFYPNPAQNHISIETGNSALTQIEISSLNGKVIFHAELEGNLHQIDLSSYQKGVYFITFRSKEQVTTRKLIKQ